VAEIESMLSLGPGEGPPTAIVRTVATRDEGTRALADAIAAFHARARDTGALAAKRRGQLRRQLDDAVRRRLMDRLVSTLQPGETDALVDRIARREIDPFTAAEELSSRMAGA
jgi:LAO/AO transport system kinase